MVTAKEASATLALFLAANSKQPNVKRVSNPRQHECSSDCDMFECGRVYVCHHSGNYHICTPNECDRLVETVDARVCGITNVAYPLSFEFSTTSDEFNTVEAIPVPRPKVVPGAPKRKRQVKPIKVNYFENQVLARRTLLGAFRPSPKLLERVDVDAMAKLCLDLWERIIQTKAFQREKGCYKFAHHVYVVLFDMIDGVQNPRRRDEWIVPFNPHVRRYLTDERTMKKCLPGYKPNRITKTTRMFHAFLAELYSSRDKR
jgi:hypothetical protein